MRKIRPGYSLVYKCLGRYMWNDMKNIDKIKMM